MIAVRTIRIVNNIRVAKQLGAVVLLRRSCNANIIQVARFSNDNTASSWGDDDKSVAKKSQKNKESEADGVVNEVVPLKVSADGYNIIYFGKFGGRLKSVRRVSLTSSIISVVGFPLAITFGTSSTLPVSGQIAMAGTVIATSLASTAFLQMVCHSYVSLVEEIPSQKLINGTIDRKFRATRLNLIGKEIKTEFYASQVEKIIKTAHPFATFKVDGIVYYVHKPSVEDSTAVDLF